MDGARWSMEVSGMTDFMNLRARLEPQGSCRGLSKVFPNRISSALHGFKTLPTKVEADYQPATRHGRGRKDANGEHRQSEVHSP
jgi:hypothetical protein